MASRASPLLGPALTPGGARSLALAVFAGALAMPLLVAWSVGAFAEAPEVRLPEQVVERHPALVAVPGGWFRIGSTLEQQDAAIATDADPAAAARSYRDDLTQRRAEVQAFELCRTEVTQGQWKAVMGVDALSPEQCGEEACEDDKPITGVRWQAALAYLVRLTVVENERRGQGEQMSLCYAVAGDALVWDRRCTGFRLPTEAEWEYAARAGSEAAYHFGDDPKDICEYANVLDDPGAGCDDGAAGLARVGSYRANAWGLVDVHGNVAEWAWDLFRPDLAANPVMPTDDGRVGVLRGGSFEEPYRDLRAAHRRWASPTQAQRSVGLRCARGAQRVP